MEMTQWVRHLEKDSSYGTADRELTVREDAHDGHGHGVTYRPGEAGAAVA
jgi:hypothetical protein